MIFIGDTSIHKATKIPTTVRKVYKILINIVHLTSSKFFIVPEIAQKPVEPMTRMKHPRVIDVQKNTKNLRASDGEIVDNALSDISDEIDDFIKPHRVSTFFIQ